MFEGKRVESGETYLPFPLQLLGLRRRVLHTTEVSGPSWPEAISPMLGANRPETFASLHAIQACYRCIRV